MMILLEVRQNFQRLSFLVKIVALLLVVINLAYALYFFGYSGISAGGTWYFDFTQPLRFSAWYLPIFLIVISGLLKQRSIFEQIRFTTEQKFKVDLLLILLSMIMILAVTVLPVAIIVLIRFSPHFLDWFYELFIIGLEYFMMLGLVGMIYYFFSQIFRQTYFISGFLLAMFISISVFKSQFTNQAIFMFFSQNKSYDFPLVIKLMTFVGLILCLNAGSYELLRRRESLGERQ